MESKLSLKKRKLRPPKIVSENRPNTDTYDVKISQTGRISKIFQRALANAAKHGIRLYPGRENPGQGN